MSTMPKRSRQSVLAMISIGLTVVAFIVFILASVMPELADYSTILMAMGIALLAVSWGIYLFGGRGSSKKEPSEEKVMTVIGCRNCDVREERDFQQGDYIPKELGPCKKCGGKSYIKAIYAIPIKKE
jgi:hypothetical protein